MEDRCIQIQLRSWGKVFTATMTVAEYEDRRNETTYGYRRLVPTTPHAAALTSQPGPGFHSAHVINEAVWEQQMQCLLGLV